MRTTAWLLLIVAIAAIAWLVFSGDFAVAPKSQKPDGTQEDDDTGVTLEGRAPAPLTVDAALRRGWQMPGRVIDARGDPVAGVRIVVRRRAANRGHGGNASRLLDYTWRNAPRALDVIEETRSDADGRFGVSPPADASWWLSVEAHPEPPRVGTSRLIAGLRYELPALVLVVTDGHSLEGRVVDAEGNGVSAGIDLSLFSALAWQGSGSRYSVTGLATDSDGRFRIPAVPAGRVQLTVVVAGRIVRMFGVSVPHAGELVLRLYEPNGARVVGSVTDKSKAPIAGARMALRLAAKDSGVYAMGQTDAAGRYACEGLPAGALNEVVFEADGYRIKRYEAGDRPLAAGETLTVDVTLERGAAIEGTVRTQDGSPVRGAPVRITASEKSNLGHWTVETDDSGAFRLDGLPPNAWAGVRVDAEGLYQPEQNEGAVTGRKPTRLRVKLPDGGESVRADVVLDPAIALRGRVVDTAGAGVVGAEVRLVVADPVPQALQNYVYNPTMMPLARTAADGAFRFGLPPGTVWRARAFKGLGRSPPSEIIKIPANGEAPTVELVMGSAASIEGVVTSPDDAPAIGLRVYVKGETEHRTRTCPGGRFVVAGLTPGAYQVKVGRDRRTLVADPLTVTLAESERRMLEIATRQPLVTTGRILDIDGNPVRNRLVLLQPAETSGVYGEALHTDDAGAFELRHWEPGAYRILVGSSSAGDTFEAGAQGLVLRVKPAGRDRVTLRIFGPDGKPVPQCEVEIMTGGTNSKSGSTDRVDGGVYVVRTRTLSTHTDITVKNARDADGNEMNVRPATLINVDMNRDEIVIRLEAGRTLTGVVVGPRGEPVDGVRVVLAGSSVILGASGGETLLQGAVSDAEGRFRIDGLPEGVILDVTPTAPYIAPGQVEVADGQNDVRIALERGQTFVVTVVGSDAKPLPGVSVRVYPSRFPARWDRRGHTNEDGVFEADGIDGSASINISVDPGEALPKTERRGLAFGDGRVRIQLPAPVFIEGTVVDPEGKPVAAQYVSIDGQVKPRPFAIFRRGTVDKNTGRFRVGPVGTGTFRISVHGLRAPWTDQGQITVEAPTTSARIVVAKATTIAGRLLVDHIKGWSVVWRSGSQGVAANLSDEGRFKLDDVPDLAGVLWARGPNGQYALLEGIRPSAGPFTLRPQEGRAIRGRIEGFEGDPLHFHVWAARGGVYVGGSVAKDGTFEIKGVPTGAWRVVLQYNTKEIDGADDVDVGSEAVVLRVP